MTFLEGAYMQFNGIRFAFAAVLSALAIAAATAQAQRPAAQPGQQAQPPQPTQTFPAQQPVGQPLLVVPGAPAPPAEVRLNPELPTVELVPLLQRVERQSNKQFLLDPRIGPRIYVGGVEPNDVTYPLLLAIFRNNGFAAFEANGRVNIVPDAAIRFYAPVVQTDDTSIPADLYVTRIIKTMNVNSAFLVPILRPLLPQSAHLAAHADSSQLLVMDRYENIQRISEIVRALDVCGPDGCTPIR
jgi:type II secretory pathway component GspD/PulD (secretin)